MKNMTAIEVLARNEAYKPVLAEIDRRLNKTLGRIGSKLVLQMLRVMTNYGPILGFINPPTIVGRLPND